MAKTLRDYAGWFLIIEGLLSIIILGGGFTFTGFANIGRVIRIIIGIMLLTRKI